MCGWVVALGDTNIDPAMWAIRHRGIRSKVVKTRWGSVGHVRLPIVGLSENFDQPIEKDGWTIAFTGEILDFKYTHPDAQSDVEVLKELWGNFGVSLHDRDGFWSIGAIHPSTGSLYILCDYLAQKPTYYRTDPPAAASELGPLLTMGPTALDEVYLSSVIKWGYCPDTRRTPYASIKRVLPGERVLISQKGYVRSSVVDPLVPLDPQYMWESIEKAVRIRVESSDVPVAALVSGGLDSAIVHKLAERYGDVVVFHVENGEEDELRRVVGWKYTKIELNDVTLGHALDYMEEPIDLGSLIPQVALSDAMGSKYSVCLTGDGADEFFGGYGRSTRYDSQYSDVFQELVAWHLPRLDRVMMRNCIEVRSPFLSRWVAAKALSLPWFECRRDKKYLRHLFSHLLPKEISQGVKKPLRAPDVEGDNRMKRSIELVQMLRDRWRTYS